MNLVEYLLVSEWFLVEKKEIIVARFQQNYENWNIWYYLLWILICLFIILLIIIFSQKKCPYCFEKISKWAQKCKHCGERIQNTKNKLIKINKDSNMSYLLWSNSDIVKIVKKLLAKNSVKTSKDHLNNWVEFEQFSNKLWLKANESEALKAILIYKWILNEDKDFKHRRFSLLYQEYSKKEPKLKESKDWQHIDQTNLNNKNVINEYRTVNGNTFRYINLLPEADSTKACYKCKKNYKGIAYNCPNCWENFWHTYEEYVDYINNQ